MKEEDLTEDERTEIISKLNQEMHEIYYGRNFDRSDF